MTKKKILVIADNPLAPSGVGTQTKYMIEKNGIEWVTQNLMAPDHVIGKYKAPGEV